MSYGLQILSNAGQLLIDTNSLNLHYAGQAGHIGSDGYKHVYSITLPAFSWILPFIRPVAGSYFKSSSVVFQGGTTWHIHVWAAYPGDAPALPTAVYVFAPLPNGIPANQYGMQCFRADGSCGFDSTRNPLAIRSLTFAPTTGSYVNGHVIQNFGVPALAIPAVCGGGAGDRIVYSPIGFGQSIVRAYTGMLTFLSPTVIQRACPTEVSNYIEDVEISQEQTFYWDEVILLTDMARIL